MSDLQIFTRHLLNERLLLAVKSRDLDDQLNTLYVIYESGEAPDLAKLLVDYLRRRREILLLERRLIDDLLRDLSKICGDPIPLEEGCRV